MGLEVPVRLIEEIWTRGPCDNPDCKQRPHEVDKIDYRLPDGTPLPELRTGDVYFTPDHRNRYKCEWDDCDGRHLICMIPHDRVPGRYHWNIDGRANNCTMPEDRRHRCWVRHGDPATPGALHVDKTGTTCKAGAGSIAVPGFHAMLQHGVLRQC